MHQALSEIARALEALRDECRSRMNRTATPEESDRLYLQILEINHRLVMVHQLMLEQGFAELGAHVAAIRAAKEEVDAAIAEHEQLNAAIDGIKNILGIVDTVIDVVS